MQSESQIARFEAAADAIVSGDSATLQRLLSEDPELVRARSTREHRSTLLHYVSANGVEDFRQKTPGNIIEITEMLLNAGADIHAEADAYGGRWTTLGLTATSCHPENAGVQLSLLELLIRRGAGLDGPDGTSTVNACLHNGRGLAAEYLAGRGARLDLEGAAGVGRLDVVQSFFDDAGLVKAPATMEQATDGFAWACEFGRTPVVHFLLQHGVPADAKFKQYGQTGLHWAAYGGHPDTVKLLLERGSLTGAKDNTYSGTPLGWALHAWGCLSEKSRAARRSYYETVALLVRAGSELDPRDAEHIRTDPLMMAAVRGESPVA